VSRLTLVQSSIGAGVSWIRAAFWCCAAGVFYLAVQPAPEVQVASWDKANHAFAFAVLGTLALLGWRERAQRVISFLFGYGCLLEVVQSLLPTRQADWQDVVADSVGLILALVAVSLIRQLGRNRRS
jgi:VanZ family protein